MRNWWPRSPSKYSTVSTMCSSTRGPAISPSLVTWPTSTTTKPRRLASPISSCAAPRTWLTVPGALSSVSRYIVWIESITTRSGASAESRDSTMSRTLLAAARPTGRSATPSRSEEHTSELQSHSDLVCRLLLEKKKKGCQFGGHSHKKRSQLCITVTAVGNGSRLESRNRLFQNLRLRITSRINEALPGRDHVV